MNTLAVVNQKGGVGKTTVTLGLAAAAAAAGRRVLVVDLDPQANASSGLGVWGADRTLLEVMQDGAAGGALDAITPSGWDLHVGSVDLVPGNPGLAALEPTLAADPVGAQDRLRLALTGVDHDTVLIDCPPSLGLLCVNGLFAADRAVVVTEPGAWAADGVDLMLSTIQRVAQRQGGTPSVAGIIVNRVGRTRDSKYWVAQLHERFESLLLPQIALRAAVAEASAHAVPLASLGRRPGAAEADAEFSATWAALMEGSGGAPVAPGVEEVGLQTTGSVPDGDL